MNLGINLNTQNHATMNIRNPILLFAAFLFALQFNPPSEAAFIRDVTIANVSAQFVNGNDVRRATNVVNDVGMYGDAVVSIPTATTWLSTATAGSNPGANFITFDLGSVRRMTRGDGDKPRGDLFMIPPPGVDYEP